MNSNYKKLKTIIITAADEKFSELLLGLIDSLFQWKSPLSDAIGIFDVGLSENTKSKLGDRVDYYVNPGWDFNYKEELKATRPHERAKLARPFIPKYFPGYDLYLWLDADTWVQERWAIEWLFTAAHDGSMALVETQHRAYKYSNGSKGWREQYLHDYFGQEALDYYNNFLMLIDGYGYYNTGVFCLRSDSIHWESWAHYFKIALDKISDKVSDQAVLNFSIWKDKLPVKALPTLFNWTCHSSIPLLDFHKMKLVEPVIPYSPIGIIHLTNQTKNMSLKLKQDRLELDFKLQYHEVKKILQTLSNLTKK